MVARTGLVWLGLQASLCGCAVVQPGDVYDYKPITSVEIATFAGGSIVIEPVGEHCLSRLFVSSFQGDFSTEDIKSTLAELGFECSVYDEMLNCGYQFSYFSNLPSNFEEEKYQRHDVQIDANWSSQQLTPIFQLEVNAVGIDKEAYEALVSANRAAASQVERLTDDVRCL